MSNCDEKTMFVESEDDIVISGFAGRFPACDNIRELQEALFTKADLGQVDKELVHGNIHTILFIKKLRTIYSPL